MLLWAESKFVDKLANTKQYVELVPIFSRQGEACKDKIVASKTLRGVRLCTVLANFGFPEV